MVQALGIHQGSKQMVIAALSGAHTLVGKAGNKHEKLMSK